MSDCDLSFEIVVVGAGPAGLAAACAAAESGRRVAVVEASPWLGGQIWRGACDAPGSYPTPPPEERGGERRRFSDRSRTANPGPVVGRAVPCPPPSMNSHDAPPSARRWLARFYNSDTTLMHSTTVIAAPRPGVLLVQQQEGSRQVHWQRLILSTGARELFLPFPGWTLPGVMGPGGLQALAKQGWPVQNQRIVVAGSGPLLIATADGLARHGAHIITLAEQAPWQRVFGFGVRLCSYQAKLWQAVSLRMRLTGVPYKCGTWPLRADGDEQIRSVTLTDGNRTWNEDCDLFACGFGLLPNVELPLLLGCELIDGNVKVDCWQATSVKNVYCAGEPTGIGGADCALIEGQIAGYAAASKTDRAKALFPKRAIWHRFRSALARAFTLRPELKRLATDDTLVCRCEDVTLGRLREFTNWREAKLLTRCGMGSCQGRVCGGATQFLFGWGAESVRPPILPAKVVNLISHAPLEPQIRSLVREFLS